MTRFPPPPPGAERRAHPRHDVVVSVEVAHDDVVAIATLVNVSHGGAFLQLADLDALAIGVRVRLVLAAQGREVKADGRIVRLTGGERAGIAVAWRSPSAALRKLIDRLVATAPAMLPTSPEPPASEVSVDAGW